MLVLNPWFIDNQEQKKTILKNHRELNFVVFFYFRVLFVHHFICTHTGSLTNEQFLQVLDTCSEFYENIRKWWLEVQHTFMISYAFIHKHSHIIRNVWRPDTVTCVIRTIIFHYTFFKRFFYYVTRAAQKIKLLLLHYDFKK